MYIVGYNRKGSRMSQALALAQYQPAARGTMEPAAFAYVAGGAGEGACVARNAAAWGDVLLRPRVMRPMAGLRTAVRCAGLDLGFPCLVAPMAFQRLAHPDGERAMAMAAAAQGAGMVLSCQTSRAPQEVAVAPYWFQLYLQPTLAASLRLVAQATGAQGLVVTLDAPVNGVRNAEIAAGFALPNDVRAVMMEALPEVSSIEDLLARAPVWADLAALCAAVTGPVLAKGIMGIEDARLAMAAGCAGVIVSNHGGRVLEGLPATAQVLPQIAAVLRAEWPEAVVLVDGGIRSGEDMVRAIALGADAVLLGRPAYFALAVGGAQGVSACLRRLRDEFTVTMGLMGVRTVEEIGPHCLFDR